MSFMGKVVGVEIVREGKLVTVGKVTILIDGIPEIALAFLGDTELEVELKPKKKVSG